MDKFLNLRKRPPVGTEKEMIWSLENIIDGFEYFLELNGHYPGTQEIDGFQYLPTSRTIQRSFGGVVAVKKQLNLKGPHKLSEGETRSNKAREADVRARIYEEEFYNFLVSHVPEMRVHEHKMIRPGQTACDFFIYTEEHNGFVVDLFYAQDLISLNNVLNIKIKKYLDVKYQTYFVVVGNDKIIQSEIDAKVLNKKNILPRHISVMTEVSFKENLKLLI
jgi:hypothetical protein